MHPVSTSLAALLAGLALVAPARADFVYALSNNDGRVIRYQTADPVGTVTEVRAATNRQAAGLALGPDGNLYVGEWGDFGSIAPSITRIELANNNATTTVHSFGTTGWFPGSLVFRNATDLLVGRAPFPLFAPGPVVQVNNATGGTITVSDYTSGSTLAGSPGLALAADGTLYVSDQTFDVDPENPPLGTSSGPVKRFDATGAFVDVVIADGAEGLAGPTGLAIIGDTLFTASIMNGQVLQTNLLDDTTTDFGAVIAPFQTSPLAALSDGGLVVGSAGGAGAIYRLDAAGQLVSTFDSGLGTIGGLVVAPVPEPAAVVTAAAGLAALAAWLRRRRGRA
jgi:sugar lactone lactonase YvrE